MKMSSPLQTWRWIAMAGVLLLCLSPFAAAQNAPPSAKPKPPANAAQPPVQQGSPATAQASRKSSDDDDLNESGDAVRRREEWFYGQRAYPLGQIPPGMLEKASEHLQRMLEAQKNQGLEAPLDQGSTGFPEPSSWTSFFGRAT